MKDRPILFSASMVRAPIAGTKTQTRRAVKFPIKCKDIGCELAGCELTHELRRRPDLCPYGKPGDLLWVRETWSANYPEVGYKADTSAAYFGDGPHRGALLRMYDRQLGEWRPSIHMPRWASRLTLRVTEVRVERLQDISWSDAIAEGVWKTVGGYWSYGDEFNPSYETPMGAFQGLWESINGPDSWDANPWVWAITFEVIRQNIDSYKATQLASAHSESA
jgi:hypothetical protein